MKLQTPSRFLRAFPIMLGVGFAGHAAAQDVVLPDGAAPAEVRATPAPSEPVATPTATPVVQPVPMEELTQMDDPAFLTEWQKRCFAYFWEQADPTTGLVADRAPADGSRRYDRATHDPDAPDAPVASIAAVGFGLTAICIADERDWIDGDAAYERVATTLRFLLNEAEHVEGFYYHFMEMHDGQRAWASELSSIDTALLMAGVLTARQYYPDTEVASLATQLYDRVNWPWMMNDGLTLSMGWSPEDGFIEYRWDHFSEHLVMQVLGLGSTTHPLPPAAWHNWQRGPIFEYEGGRFMSYPPLFVHQFSHAWVDFRDKRDDYADYWANSVFATKAHRAMFTRLADRFPLYGETLWGVTSSDSAMGYTAWGGPSPSPHIDGTVVPCAAAGSIPFAPAACISAVRHMFDTYGDRAWQHYGLVDAFNPHTNWFASDVIGIDVGITLLMIENHRSEFVWDYFMRNPEVQAAMQIAGFRELPDDHAPTTALFFDVLNPDAPGSPGSPNTPGSPGYAFAPPADAPAADTPVDAAEPAHVAE